MKEPDHNPFEEIAPKDQAPESLKKEVMATISFAHLMMEVADLFTIKMGNTAFKMVDHNENNHKPKNKRSEDDTAKE